MIIKLILILAGVTAIASIINLIDDKRKKIPKVIPMKVKLPGNLPVISLSSNGKVFNFLLDSGSNISHICPEYHNKVESKLYAVAGGDSVQGLGANNTFDRVCKASLKDVLGNKYEVNFAISEGFSDVAEGIENSTGIKIHGLLGTDFLNTYDYIIDFKTLQVYPQR